MVLSTSAWADGSEALGAPSIAIANGTGIVSGGTGMLSQPGTIELDVPAGASIRQVLLYWEGFMATAVAGDDTVSVSNGGPAVSVTGTLIGGPTVFDAITTASTFRVDITGLGLVTAGINSITVNEMDYLINNGAGIMVIFDDGSTDAAIAIRDGSDLAYHPFAPPLDGTAPQTYSFAASTGARIANLDMFFASIAGSASGGTIRPSVITVTVTGPGINQLSQFDNVLDSIDGDEFDSFKVAVAVPAGANSLAVQAFSRDDLGTGFNPASFDWLAAALSLEPDDVPPGVPGRMTGGGSVFTLGNMRVTRGFEIHCDLRKPNNIEVNWANNRFHMTDLTGAICTDSPTINQLPRSAPFDTFQGEGTGKLNGVSGARIEFVFVDAGEPGQDDTASIQIFDKNNVLVLNVFGNLNRGNIQAHKDNKSTL